MPQELRERGDGPVGLLERHVAAHAVLLQWSAGKSKGIQNSRSVEGHIAVSEAEELTENLEGGREEEDGERGGFVRHLEEAGAGGVVHEGEAAGQGEETAAEGCRARDAGDGQQDRKSVV